MDVQTDFKKSIYDAIGINEIIWVDDRFSQNSGNLEDEYFNDISAMYEADDLETIKTLAAFEDVDWGLPFDVIRDSLPKDDVTISAFYKHLDKGVPDLSHSQFDNLIKLLNEASDSMLSLSNADWQRSKGDILKKDGTKLFLIDLNFEKEGLPVDHGESIVCELMRLNTENCYFVLFTSETNIGVEEEAARKSIIDKLDINADHHHFSVLSKNILDEDDGKVSLDFKSAEFLKRIFLRKLSSEMIDTVESNISESLNSLRKDLSQNSIYEIDTSIFNSSLKEGSSEFDLLHRLFTIKQKEMTHRCLTDNPDVIKKLKAFRSVQMSEPTEEEKKFINKTMQPAPNFIAMRHLEMFDVSINETHAPLSTGDVFNFSFQKEVENKGKVEIIDYVECFILIDQACDFIVRGSSGERKSSEVLLIPFEKLEKSKNSLVKVQSQDKHHLLKAASNTSDKLYYVFDFSRAITVNANFLDLAVYNTTGSLRFDNTQSDHELLFLPGWLKRFNILKANVLDHDGKIRKTLPLSYSVFSLLQNDKFVVNINEKSIWLNGKRSKKLRSPFIEELMTKYYVNYKARLALEKDFS